MNDRAGLLAFMGITEETGRVLQAFWPAVDAAMPTLLDDFYRHVTAIPQMKAMMGNHVERVKKLQAAHWRLLFSGTFDAAYFDGVTRIGAVHARVGLDPRWFIGGYNQVLGSLATLAKRRYRFSPKQRDAVMTAVNSVVLLDMDIAISMYIESAARNAAAERSRQMADLTQAFDASAGSMVQRIAAASTQMRSTAQSMTETAHMAAARSAAASGAADETSSNVQSVASSAEELSASISEISRQVTQSTQVTGKAVEDARRTDGVVKALAEGASRIGDVVSLISSIAGQTNLLALNATIEAARAGDAGKGFAVVASEVKNLATQTARATEDIARQINEIQAATHEAVSAIQEITGTIGRVSEISAAIAAAVEQQGAATQEIARNVQQAAAGTRDVRDNISAVSQGAEETGAAAVDVQSASAELSEQAERLNQVVARFIADVRAA